MITISLLAYECTAEEARSLPRGFQFLEYDSLYESFRLMTAGKADPKTGELDKGFFVFFGRVKFGKEAAKINGRTYAYQKLF